MPGYVVHLATAEKIIEALDINDEEFINQFLIGSIIPDVFVGNEKKESHFWSDETYKLFVRKPDVIAFKEKYIKHIKEPFVLGYYTHLLLDQMFIDHYWFSYFLFYNADMQKATLYDEVAHVYLAGDDKVYTREEFFSKDMYYGDYDRMNSYFIEKYDIRTPKLTKGIKCIEEVDYEVAEPVLKNMIRNLFVENHNINTPNLRVFVLEELEKLIEEVVEKILLDIKDFYK